MKNLVVLGTTNNLIIKQVDAINRVRNGYRLLGFLEKEKGETESVLEYPVLGDYQIIPVLMEQYKDLVFFNHVNVSLDEMKTADAVLNRYSCERISLIHPAIDMNRVCHGQNCLICDGTVMGANVNIGRHFTCRLHATISHDVTIGDYVYVSPGATVCGYATLKDGCDLGAGCTVLPYRSIGKNSIVGAGAVVTQDVPDDVTVVGVPAKIIRRHDEPAGK